MDTQYIDSKIGYDLDDFIVPEWILDDVGYFYPEVYQHIYQEKNKIVTFPMTYKDTFIQLRKQTYWLCNWYDELIKEGIPVIPSKIICIHNDTTIMKNILDKELTDEYKFLRFCNASPKDIIEPIFNKNSPDICNVFQTSHRTNYMFNTNLISNIPLVNNTLNNTLYIPSTDTSSINSFSTCASLHKTHLVIRPVVHIDHEVRCLWHKHKLRAVSGPLYYVNDVIQNDIKNAVDHFFQTYGSSIPYNSATIDLGINLSANLNNNNLNNNYKTFIVEINSFGSDMLAVSAHFNWKEDFMILYNAKTPVYRFKEEFEW